jgi:peptidoglycan/xylan/chitin deacetylase (PgdA/CDA1 family)
MLQKIIPLLELLFPSVVWRIKTKEKVVYLTFDDGPHPEITPWVLSQLTKYNFKASFFCIGKNIEAFPEITKRILEAGHSIGNHSYSHKKGTKTSLKNYIEDVNRCQELLPGNTLFRPPYGKMTLKQYRSLKKNYRIVLWDVISYDFDILKSEVDCLKKSLGYRPGSIIVFQVSD